MRSITARLSTYCSPASSGLEDLGTGWETALPQYWDRKIPIPDPDMRAKLHDEVIACLRLPDIRKWFSREARGGDQAHVWREKAFDVMFDGKWVSGVFDRVIFSSDGTAAILDFKSNRLGETTTEHLIAVAKTYAEQMADYRDALPLLAKKTMSKAIDVFLLFTDARRLVAE